MYWPLGTPRIYAISSSRNADFRPIVSHDGLPQPDHPDQGSDANSHLSPNSAAPLDTPFSPVTPVTPLTPGIKPVYDDHHEENSSDRPDEPAPPSLPSREPIVALRVARLGQMFAVLTSTSLTIWQTKVGYSLSHLFPPNCSFWSVASIV